MKETTVTVYTTRSILQFAAYHGADPGEICTATGLDPEMLTMPDERIPGSLHAAVWREAVKQTGDENLGLHLGEAFNLATFGTVGYILINCQTLGEAFEKLVRYDHLFCQSAEFCVSVSNGMVFFDCDYHMTGSLQHPIVEERRYAVECTFASSLKATLDLTGKPLPLSAVWFQHTPPENIAEYKRIFQTDLQFLRPNNRLIFDASCLDWPILSSNPALLPMFEQYAQVVLQDTHFNKNYMQQVKQAIAHQLTGDLPAIGAIAQELAISVRHLQRELRAEGTSFQKLLDATRKELALQHLKNPTVPIHDIAFLLGFSEPSTFNRAFKRWTGSTPRTYRLSKDSVNPSQKLTSSTAIEAS
ncbi:MAG: AraC family transcriptional regulator [Cyanobacteria bacterium J069]|nr:MAG: AraC family transcriptional regulator [Cyanobacteria bacterium J069]